MIQFKQTFPTPAEHSAGKNSCKFIIIHHTGTAPETIKGVLDGLNKRADYASCHYVVDINGDVYKIGQDVDILWHAGVSEWKGLHDLNEHSIGIEIIGVDEFTDEQRAAVKQLTKSLMAEHGIPKENVLRHAMIAPKRKTDVHPNFYAPGTWEDWQNQLNTPTLMNILEQIIRLMQDLWPVVSPDLKQRVAGAAVNLRALQSALGLPVTK